jgi:hypothetical protein
MFINRILLWYYVSMHGAPVQMSTPIRQWYDSRLAVGIGSIITGLAISGFRQALGRAGGTDSPAGGFR